MDFKLFCNLLDAALAGKFIIGDFYNEYKIHTSNEGSVQILHYNDIEYYLLLYDSYNARTKPPYVEHTGAMLAYEKLMSNTITSYGLQSNNSDLRYTSPILQIRGMPTDHKDIVQNFLPHNSYYDYLNIIRLQELMAQPDIMLSLESCISPADYLRHPDFSEGSFQLTNPFNITPANRSIAYAAMHDEYLKNMNETYKCKVSVPNQFHEYHTKDFLKGKYGRIALKFIPHIIKEQ